MEKDSRLTRAGVSGFSKPKKIAEKTARYR